MRLAASPARNRLFVATLCILATGGLLAGWMIAQTDRALRTELQGTTRMVAQTINPERIKALTGTAADLENTSYTRLKEQLSAIRAAQSQCRFIYLLGRKADGSIFFFGDSEPADSKDCSPPGQLFAEAPEGIRLAFTNRTAACLGPIPPPRYSLGHSFGDDSLRGAHEREARRNPTGRGSGGRP